MSRDLCSWPKESLVSARTGCFNLSICVHSNLVVPVCCRRMSMDPDTEGNKVRFIVNDVGASTWEEMSEGGDDWANATEWGWKLGVQNFGWPSKSRKSSFCS